MRATIQAVRYGVTVMFALVLLFFLSSPVFADDQIRHRILIIYPFDRSIPFSIRFLAGLTESLGPCDLNTFEIFQENLDLDRIESDEYLDSLAAYLATSTLRRTSTRS